MRTIQILAALFVPVLTTGAAAQDHACPGSIDFDSPIFNSSGPGARDLAIGYLNADLKLDLAVVNADNGTVSTFLGNGSGTFTPDVNIYTGFDAYAVEILSADGFESQARLVIAHEDTSVVMMDRNGTGFTTTWLCDVDGVVTSVSGIDTNGNGIDEMALTIDHPAGVGQVVVWTDAFPPGIGFCDSLFTGLFITGSEPCALGMVDSDLSGLKNDYVVVSKAEGVVYLHTPSGISTFPVGPEPCQMAIGDVNEDGIDDLVIALEGINAIRVLRGDGVGGFLPAVNVSYIATSNPGPTDIILADFNHDDELDIILATNGFPAIFFFPGNGSGTFGAAIPLSFEYDHSVGAADVDADGAIDLISTTPASLTGPTDGFKVWFSNCTLCPADVNGDGIVNAADFTAWIAAFTAGDPECDQNGDGNCDASDFTSWIANFTDGC